MRNNRILSLGTILLLVFTFIACENETDLHFADKYIGKYECISENYVFVISDPDSMNPYIKLIYDTVIISVESYDLSEDYLLISELSIGADLIASVKNDGKFTTLIKNENPCNSGSGYFTNDSISFEQTYSFCENRIFYKGVKLKN